MHQNEYDFSWWWEAFTRDAARRVKLGTSATWICRYEQEPGSGITQAVLVLLRDIKAYPETAKFTLVPDFLDSWDNFFKEDEGGMTRDELILLIKEQLKGIIERQSRERGRRQSLSKRLTRILIKGVSDEDYEAYKHILELNMRTIFSSIVEKSISDPDFKNGEGRYVWPLIIKDLHYKSALEQVTIYRMEKGKIIVILAFELGSMYMSIYRSDEEYRNRIEKLKEIAADIFENLVEGVKKSGIDIDGEVHMDFDSFTPRRGGSQ